MQSPNSKRFESRIPDACTTMKKNWVSISFLGLFFLLIYSCKKTEKLNIATVHDYYPMSVGKYITYQLDSTVFLDFGTIEEVQSYQLEDIVDAQSTDNSGRISYRIRRMISASAGQNPWSDLASYLVTPLDHSVEIVDDNFRYIKLSDPISEGFNWKGNAYISIISEDPNWDYRYLDDWDYTYANVNQPYTVNGITIDSSVTINQRDEIVGYPDIDTLYSERNYSVEIYAKGIGLSFKDFLHWEYQPATPGKLAEKKGYGIRLNIIDHN